MQVIWMERNKTTTHANYIKNVILFLPSSQNKGHDVTWFRNSKVIPWDSVLGSFDLSEELLRCTVIERELSIEHGEENHSQSPHVTRLSHVRLAWGHTDRRRGEEHSSEPATVLFSLIVANCTAITSYNIIVATGRLDGTDPENTRE